MADKLPKGVIDEGSNIFKFLSKNFCADLVVFKQARPHLKIIAVVPLWNNYQTSSHQGYCVICEPRCGGRDIQSDKKR